MTLWMILIMLIGFWLVSRFANKQQQKMLEEQKRRTDEALVVGNWVKTRAGFYGTVVEIDGDVVTLATPLGDESLWEKSAILGAEEPPFASTAQDDEAQDAQDDVAGLIADDDAAFEDDDDAESGAQDEADDDADAASGADDADAVEGEGRRA
ncbi:preprotein translocase subunit YajC [Actinomyces dentalis]|jgi:preprotein translocase subunit|uniref:preprotein translocase subunit YajC n=1 Tax=Actinomyces dentalis TaxID=272548 RepID=UPI0004297009|nr:preprotein translocase subunit YajC [Actinomyces dentalis]